MAPRGTRNPVTLDTCRQVSTPAGIWPCSVFNKTSMLLSSGLTASTLARPGPRKQAVRMTCSPPQTARQNHRATQALSTLGIPSNCRSISLLMPAVASRGGNEQRAAFGCVAGVNCRRRFTASILNLAKLGIWRHEILVSIRASLNQNLPMRAS
jgi:hypothetical protein